MTASIVKYSIPMVSNANAEVVIVGAGIVGMAVARELQAQRPGVSLLVCEKETAVGMHQSGHNSGVLHSGLYYAPGSIKAATCVAGREAMLRFLKEHQLPHEICGKLVVATTEAQLPMLRELWRRGQANGVQGLSWLESDEIRRVEPHCSGLNAIHVASAGITDYGAVTRKLAALVVAGDGRLLTECAVREVSRESGTLVLHTSQGEVRAKWLINCAGLHADWLSRKCGSETRIHILPFRGEYFRLTAAGEGQVRSLIYPVPDPRYPFLGVHFTRMIGGGVEAGPNAVMALAREGYSWSAVHPGELLQFMTFAGFWRLARRHWRTGLAEVARSWSKQRFARSLQQLVPTIGAADLLPGGAGVRAQAVDERGNLLDDFHFVNDGQCLHVLNVPSPAATASLAIATRVVNEFLGSRNL